MFQVPDTFTSTMIIIMWVSIGRLVWEGHKFKKKLRSIRQQHYLDLKRIIEEGQNEKLKKAVKNANL